MCACNQPLLWLLWLLPRSSLSVLLRVPVLCHPGSRRWNNPIIISTAEGLPMDFSIGVDSAVHVHGRQPQGLESDKEWGQFFGWHTPSYPQLNNNNSNTHGETNKIQEEFPSHFHHDAMAIKTKGIRLNDRTPDLGATTKHFPCLCHSGFALTLGK